MKTKYDEGYQTGLTWNHPHTPGGPFHYTTRSINPEHIALAEQTIKDHADWMAGWQQGIADRDCNKGIL